MQRQNWAFEQKTRAHVRAGAWSRASATAKLSLAMDDLQVVEEGRRLEPLCEVPTSAEARAVKARLRKQPAVAKETRLALYAKADLCNMVRLVLSVGTSPDTLYEGRPVLFLAVRAGAVRALKALLDGGADVSLVDARGRTALHCAVYEGQTECARLLLLAGSPLEAKNTIGTSPLYTAAAYNQVSVCELLLKAGAKPSATDPGGRTCLHAAAGVGGSPAVISLLLEAGADIDEKDMSGGTPLWAAATQGKVGAVCRLLARGANPNSVDKNARTPLLWAIAKQHPLAVRALLPVSDLGVRDVRGMCAIHLAVLAGTDDVFRLVLPYVTDLEARTLPNKSPGGEDCAFNCSALHIACAAGRLAMARALLRRGASPMAADNKGATTLHTAANNGYLSCVAALLGKPGAFRLTPAEVDMVTRGGFTALHAASAQGDLRACGLLIQAGASLDAKTDKGMTPLMLAQQKHPDDAAEALHLLLAGTWPGPLPGTYCEHCSAVPDSQLMHCSGCQAVSYCCPRCAAADWPDHAAFCLAARKLREQ